MRYFLVDTENISKYDFIQEYDLTNEDTLVMFVSEKSQNISVMDLLNITRRNIQIKEEEVYAGTENALDFQLVAKLSIMVCTLDKGTPFYIVSNDGGFNVAVKYLKETMDANIEIIKTVCNEIAFDIDNLDIEKELDEATKEVINNSGTLSELHNNLRALHGNEKGRELYLKVKKSLESKSVK